MQLLVYLNELLYNVRIVLMLLIGVPLIVAVLLALLAAIRAGSDSVPYHVGLSLGKLRHGSAERAVIEDGVVLIVHTVVLRLHLLLLKVHLVGVERLIIRLLLRDLERMVLLSRRWLTERMVASEVGSEHLLLVMRLLLC